MTAGAVAAVLLAAPAVADRPGSNTGMAGMAQISIVPPPPAEPTSDPPSINPHPNPQPGDTLTLDRGDYDDDATDGQRWLLCDAGGDNCEFTDNTTKEFSLTTAEVGSTLRVRVRRDMLGGFREVDTAPSEEVQPTPVTPPPPPPATGTGKPAYTTPVKAPRNTSRPRFSGRLREGTILTGARGSFSGTTPISYRYRWYRCAEICKSIPFATRPVYRLQSADVRKRVELVVTAFNGAGKTRAATPITGLIAPRRIRRIHARVAIAGRVTRRGAKLTRFSVRAERGATIAIHCRGRGCPFTRLSAPTPRGGLLRVRRLQRRLRGGIVIDVRVTKLFQTGKYTRLRIRRARLPVRADRCLKAGSTRPVRCSR